MKPLFRELNSKTKTGEHSKQKPQLLHQSVKFKLHTKPAHPRQLNQSLSPAPAKARQKPCLSAKQKPPPTLHHHEHQKQV
jgi:hypothetical protein